MQLYLLNDEQFVRHVENLQKLDTPEVEKALLERLKNKIDILNSVCSFMSDSYYTSSYTLGHDDILSELETWEDNLEILAKIEGLITK